MASATGRRAEVFFVGPRLRLIYGRSDRLFHVLRFTFSTFLKSQNITELSNYSVLDDVVSQIVFMFTD